MSVIWSSQSTNSCTSWDQQLNGEGWSHVRTCSVISSWVEHVEKKVQSHLFQHSIVVLTTEWSEENLESHIWKVTRDSSNIQSVPTDWLTGKLLREVVLSSPNMPLSCYSLCNLPLLLRKIVGAMVSLSSTVQLSCMNLKRWFVMESAWRWFIIDIVGTMEYTAVVCDL